MAFDIERVAQLARLNLKPEEKKKLEKDLAAILGYVEKLKVIDTRKVEPTSHVFPLKNVFREDEVKPSLAQADVMNMAIEKHQGSFKVPKVIE